MEKISLTASMRSNLLSLQTISKQVDSTQNKLSTGKKVNSAIDNPNSYYTARSLTNRASDLDALLDSMGQAVSTIKAATEALESAADFLEQAKAVATQTLENTQEVITYVSTKDELTTALQDEKISQIILTQSITFDIDDTLVIGEGKTLSAASTDVTLNFTAPSHDFYYAIELADTAIIRDININYDGFTSPVTHSIIGGGSIKGIVNIRATNSVVAVHSCNITEGAVVNIDGSGIYARGLYNCTLNGTANIKIKDGIYAIRDSNVNGNANLIISGNGVHGFSEVLTSPQITQIDSSAVVKIYSSNGAKPLYITQINSGAEVWLNNGTDMVQYKTTANLTQAEASSLSAYVTGETTSADDFKTTIEEIITNNNIEKNPDAKIDSSQYISIISQYDSLIKDASYKGVNLLQEQDLKVTFNEGRTAWLDVIGKNASSAALGLTTLEWNTKADVEKSIEELTNAMNQIRSMSSELGSYYNIVLSRQDFTENLINVLEEGADKLTLADMNEESANMLALQTRQQLAINSLSLASQAAQGILRLF